MLESGLNTFDKLINNPDFADVVLVVKDSVEFLVHSPIIALNSPYYNAALKPHWKPSKSKEDRIKLTHPDIDKETMKLILDYLYTFKTDGINKDNIGKVFMAADYFGMEHLVEYCKNEVGEDNAVELFRVSYTLDYLFFARTCVTHFKDLERIKGFPSFSISMILFIITSILSKTNWMELESIDCWKLIWRWSKANSNGKLNDSAVDRFLKVLNEMRERAVFFRFDAEEYETIIDNIVESFNDSQSRSRVFQLLKEHRIMEGGIVPQKSSSLVLSSKNRSIQRRIITQLSKFTIESERNVLVAGKGVIVKGTKDISVKFGNSSVSWELLCRASEHGFSASSFHSLCDNKGPTITLVKSKNGRICAAYNSDHWSSGYFYSPNSKGYICSVVDSNGEITFKKFTPKTKISYGAFNYSSYGPTFGVNQPTFDLHLANSCNINTNSFSNLGHLYEQLGTSTTVVSVTTLFG